MRSSGSAFISLFFHLSTFVSGDDILGCNGFIKSEIPIKYSDVVVNLYTKHGIMKDHMDCAPNNGYYFLPIYDKGEYILKIAPPSGWKFEPSEVAVTVDGVSDPCSLGKDINFVFKGFAVEGKVNSVGHDLGPKGVIVDLFSTVVPASSSSPLLSTTTDETGKFLFSPVLPGVYKIKISHPRWKLKNNEVTVNVKIGNGKIDGESLSVAGYDVSGSVISDNQPITGVSFLLFAKTKNIGVEGCDKSPLSEFNTDDIPSLKALSFVCHVTSNTEGIFSFPQVSPGGYVLVPYYKGSKSTKFDVHPQVLDITVKHESLRLTVPFEVKGFTVSGRVLWSENGNPMNDADVYLNGKKVGKTGPDGVYNLESMRAGSYIVKIEAENVSFEDTEIKVTSTSLADIFPSQYKICGSFLSSSDSGPYKVEIKSDTDNRLAKVVLTDEKGFYCVLLPKGKYNFSPKVDSSKDTVGLVFSPAQKIVEVLDRNINNVDFSQLRSLVKGKINCISVCPLIVVNLKPKQGTPLMTIAKGGTYEFKKVVPGEYDIYTEPGLGWCWEKETQSLSVINEVTEVPVFTQSGYAVTIVSSHNTKVVYYCESHPEEKQELTIAPGSTHICVPNSTPYVFEPKGCHGYPEPKMVSKSGTVSLLATTHSNTFTFRSSHQINDLILNVVHLNPNEKSSVPQTVKPKVAAVSTEGVKYEIVLQLKEGEALKLVPQAGLFLFTPLSAEIEGSNDCVYVNEPIFDAEKGHVVSGKVFAGQGKGLSDVLISITDEDGLVLITQTTQDDGTYRFPPIKQVPNYKITANKEGYVLTGLSKLGEFDAHKLAEIIVKVIDTNNSENLQGVLLSLSGGKSYRRNAQTNEDGTMSFLSLSPGEYYLKPMMKEFKFHPSNKIINVLEGATVQVTLSGERVAYSGLGRVTSLNGGGEENVVVEAVGLGDCHMLQEEATSNEKGEFRIRGLKPNCEYNIHVKKGNVNHHIEKSTPESVIVKVNSADVKELHLYALRPSSLLGVVAYVSANRPEDLKTLRLRLSREETPDVPVSLTKLSEYKPSPSGYSLKSTIVSLPPLPADGRNYVLQLESSIPQASFDYNNRPIHFKAVGSTKMFKFPFAPQLRAKDTELSQSSYLILPFLIALGLVLYNKESLISLSTSALDKALSSSPPILAKPQLAEDIITDPLLDFTKKKSKSRKT